MIKSVVAKFAGDRKGASAIEYALLIGLLTLALVGALTALGGNTSESFNAVSNGFPTS
jgi:pilus assembly protein Flp/PilA